MCEAWKNSMIKNFGNKGWSEVLYALSYKYVNGALNDYAIK